jgi:hypothetical protein
MTNLSKTFHCSPSPISIILAVMVILILAALIVGTRTSPASQPHDPFVQMVEQQMSAAFQKPIYPGVTVTSPYCGCTAKYIGAKIDGRVYDFRIEKLD